MDKPEQNRVTIVDVAREVGVSPKTVSRAIRGDDYVSPETLERIQEVVARLGYRPNRAARSLASNRSGVIGVVIPNINNPFFSEVVRGIFDATTQKNVLIPSRHFGQCDATLEDSFRASRTLLTQNPDIDGLICFNDMIAIGALEACDDLGINAPDQIAIIGFDDISIASLHRIGLTTLHVPKLEIGIQAMQMLLDGLDGLDTPTELVMKTELIQRQTA